MSVILELDKPREFRFDIAAYQDLEQQLNGAPFGKVLQDLSQGGINTLIHCLWAGLKHEDKGLTPSLVRKMLQRHIDQGRSYRTITAAVTEAITESGLFQSWSKDDDEHPEGNGSGTLTTSGGRSADG